MDYKGGRAMLAPTRGNEMRDNLELDKDLQARQEARQLLHLAEKAQQELETFSQEKIDEKYFCFARRIFYHFY